MHTAEEVGEELIDEESSELKLDDELIEEDSVDSEEEGPMFLDLGTLQQNKANEVTQLVCSCVKYFSNLYIGTRSLDPYLV